MNDCPNAEMRDRLPDLLHESLDASGRALVVAHLADCIDCQEELALLRGVRGILLVEIPRIDVAQVVAALPKPPRAATVRPIRRTWADWRVAAAVTLLAVGGSSIALVNRGQTPPVADSSIMRAATTAPVADAPIIAPSPAPSNDIVPTMTTATTATSPAPATDVANADVGDARLAGLTDQQLKTLLGEIDRLEPLPVTDPEPVSIRVNSGTPESPEAIW